MTAINGRIFNSTEDEVKAACIVVGAALEHPILRRAAATAASGRLRRETPVLHKLGNGLIVEGVVDLAFQEEGSNAAVWTVVDFKTDRECLERAVGKHMHRNFADARPRRPDRACVISCALTQLFRMCASRNVPPQTAHGWLPQFTRRDRTCASSSEIKNSHRLRFPVVTGCAGIIPALAIDISVDRAILRNAAASWGPTGPSLDRSTLSL